MNDVDDVPLWYHTIDLPDGRSTPGWFDLRPVMDRIPWPDLEGKRCLDVATWDGALAFEMERRGAAEVVATDVQDHRLWDWLPRDRETGPTYYEETQGQKGRGFEVAKQRLGSGVEREWVNIYDLSPERLGEFDVVMCGMILLHLREPFRALEALRSVTRSTLLSVEQVDPLTTVLLPRRPVSFIEGAEGRWTIFNAAGHQRMVQIAGFHVDETAQFAEPLGRGHPDVDKRPPSAWRRLRRSFRDRRFGSGVPTSAIRAHVEVRPPPLARDDGE